MEKAQEIEAKKMEKLRVWLIGGFFFFFFGYQNSVKVVFKKLNLKLVFRGQFLHYTCLTPTFKNRRGVVLALDDIGPS